MTAFAEPAAERPIVIRPAPRREPPFDDETAEPVLRIVGAHQQTLPFELSDDRHRQRRRWSAPQPTRRGELPEPQAWARRLLVVLFEVRAGRRPITQLTTQVSPGVLAGLSADLERRPRGGAASAVATVRSVHIAEPADGVVEVAAVIQTGARFRAVAARLEGLDGRWRCVRLQIG